MKTPKARLIAALLFPIVVLAANAWMNHQQREQGEVVSFKIEGFDPRDLLSGHYLIFRVNYGIPAGRGCPTSDISAAFCLKPEKRVYPADELPSQCSLYLTGLCNSQAQFDAGFERFYIPQTYAKPLEKAVQADKSSLKLSVMSNGDAAIRELLIDDKPWRERIDRYTP